MRTKAAALVAVCIFIALVIVRTNMYPPTGQNLSRVYSNSANGFSLRLPSDYTVDESYRYQEFGQGKDISGVKFTIPTSVAAGTNLSPDTYLSVEEIPQINPPVGGCTATLFIDHGTPVRMVREGDTVYSVASSTGAGAGNRYEEIIYALPSTNPCIAVRYFIHYGVIENYPIGVVREFDKQTLLAHFDSIRRTLIVVR